MSNEALQAAAIAAVLLHLGALVWPRRTGQRVYAVAGVNLVFGAAVLTVAVPAMLADVANMRASSSTELLDYSGVIAAAFETAVIVAALLALSTARIASTISWIGFALNFALALIAAVLVFTLRFPCCGYL